MKTKITESKIVFIFVAAGAALFVAGCAEMGSANTTSLLSAAGFRARTEAIWNIGPRTAMLYMIEFKK